MKHNTKKTALRRVTRRQNEEVDGRALSCESVYQDNKEKVEALRKQQAEYLANLPSCPVERNNEVRRILGKITDCEEEVESLEHYLIIIEEVSIKCADWADDILPRAVSFIARKAYQEIKSLHAKVDRAYDLTSSSIGETAD